MFFEGGICPKHKRRKAVEFAHSNFLLFKFNKNIVIHIG